MLHWFFHVYPVYVFTVAGIVTMISEPDSGNTVVSWSPPDPPNGIILYYNVRISNEDVTILVKEVNGTTIDIADHVSKDGTYSVEI